MESYNLKTASTYINNLLLARGLLRDGKAIEFAHPSRGEGGKEVTMAQIINLIHDLILKRDRDQEYRESIADTLRSLRSESTRQTAALEKQQIQNEDVARRLSLAQVQESSARKALLAAESTVRKLRLEMQRLKTTVDQVRTACINDVRKRDKEIQRLKSHLTSQQRGNKTGLVGASITINPGNIGLGGSINGIRDDAPGVNDPEYSLKQETAEFLTQLSQSLSDENDNLIGLLRTTLMTLRDLQGMSDQIRLDDTRLATFGGDDGFAQPGLLQSLPTNYEALTSNMDSVLENLKNLLTNPNFVSMDEVELRDEEIHRLRAGWEKMEARLREAFTLMNSWRKRMTNGDTINLEELKMGLDLGIGLETVNEEEISMTDESESEGEASSVFDELENNEADLCSEEETEKTTGSDMFKLKLHPSSVVLEETSGNTSSSKSPRKVAFSASIPNSPWTAEVENADASGLDLVGAGDFKRSAFAIAGPHVDVRAQRSAVHDESEAGKTRKRLPSPHAHGDERLSKLTVQDKLKVAEAAARAESVKSASPVKKSPAKRTRITGRPKRRKSTLTPEELEKLLCTSN